MTFSSVCEFVNTVYGAHSNEKDEKRGEDMRKIDFINLDVRKTVEMKRKKSPLSWNVTLIELVKDSQA